MQVTRGVEKPQEKAQREGNSMSARGWAITSLSDKNRRRSIRLHSPHPPNPQITPRSHQSINGWAEESVKLGEHESRVFS